MTQTFDYQEPSPFDPTAGLHDEPRWSKLSIASLVSSLIFCCPVTTLLGVVLGAAGAVILVNNLRQDSH